LTGYGAYSSSWPLVALGMLLLGSGGGLLNGETQKAIMSTVPRDRAGMASGISTTARFSGILLGFTALSGVLGGAIRSWISTQPCDGAEACAGLRRWADSVAAGAAESGGHLPGADWSHQAYAHGFSVLLLVAALAAVIAAAAVCRLMRSR